MPFIALKKRAKTPAANIPATFDDNTRCLDGELKAYLYWPLAVVLIAIAASSYLAGMYYAS